MFTSSKSRYTVIDQPKDRHDSLYKNIYIIVKI